MLAFTSTFYFSPVEASNFFIERLRNLTIDSQLGMGIAVGLAICAIVTVAVTTARYLLHRYKSQAANPELKKSLV